MLALIEWLITIALLPPTVASCVNETLSCWLAVNLLVKPRGRITSPKAVIRGTSNQRLAAHLFCSVK